MGILNVTPDSFSDGGRYQDVAAAVGQGLQLAADGAAVIDIGGESTRPGAEPVSADNELRRVIPVIAALRQQSTIPISIDTMKASVAREALAAGANIVNDVSGLTFDRKMPETCAASDCGVIVMHMQGSPQTMQANPHYIDVVTEIRQFFDHQLHQLAAAGIEPHRVMLDPGIGFGKAARHNLQLMHSLKELRAAGRPLLIGHSRKRFLKHLLGRELDERSAGTLGVAIALAEQGVDLLRVHEVSPLRDALIAWQAIRTGEIHTLSGGNDTVF
ncbi:MAG: dihydropteroate synthase [Planctomycetota bacterium]|nr:MAG: dihydropteroate synthase [Planctomycetota bacterium]